MTERLPTKLGLEPIVVAICELRFEAVAQSAVNLLPGLFFEKFQSFDAIERTPLADIPQEVSPQEWQTQPHVRLRRGNLIIAVGPQVVSLTNPAPYLGWVKFSEYAFEVFSVLKERSFIKGFTRISLRYTDILPVKNGPGIDLLNLELKLGKSSTHDVLQMRSERKQDDISIISQIAGPAASEDGRNGVVVDVDTIASAPIDFWKDHATAYAKLHAVNKQTFFELLKPETIADLKPEY